MLEGYGGFGKSFHMIITLAENQGYVNIAMEPAGVTCVCVVGR